MGRASLCYRPLLRPPLRSVAKRLATSTATVKLTLSLTLGGTALYNDWAPTTGGQYKGFMSTARAALANLDASKTEYEIVGMLWLQGESDAHENRAEGYEKNLTAFIEHMREQFKAPEMPFVIARVMNHYGGKTGQAKIVRDAQQKIAETDPHAAWFDTDGLPLNDPGHYNGEGLIEIGKRFAKAYSEIVKAVD